MRIEATALGFRWALLPCALIAASCVAHRVTSGVPNARVTTVGKASGASAAGGQASGLNLGGGTTMFFSDVYGLEADWVSAPRTVTLYVTEVDVSDPASPVAIGDLVEQGYAYSTSYSIRTVSARHTNEIYVAGTGRGGVTIIERWIRPRQATAYYSEKGTAPPVIGTPVDMEPLTVGIGESNSGSGSSGGGAPPYTHPMGCVAPPPPVREEVYRGFDIGPVYDMAIDPEGRFALVTTRDSQNVYQLVFSDPPTVTPIYSPASLSVMRSERVGIQVREHVTEGRMYLFVGRRSEPPLAPDMQLIGDTDNDGVFDTQSQLFTNSAYRASSYGRAANWVGNYRDYTYVP